LHYGADQIGGGEVRGGGDYLDIYIVIKERQVNYFF
jgi:hypothetical protein